MQKMKEQDEMDEEKFSECESVKSALIICNVSKSKNTLAIEHGYSNL